MGTAASLFGCCYAFGRAARLACRQLCVVVVGRANGGGGRQGTCQGGYARAVVPLWWWERVVVPGLRVSLQF